jgi:hypothetical protein
LKSTFYYFVISFIFLQFNILLYATFSFTLICFLHLSSSSHVFVSEYVVFTYVYCTVFALGRNFTKE